MTTSIGTPRSGRLSEADCDIDDFRALVSQQTDSADYPFASGTERNVLLYDAETVRLLGADVTTRAELQDELARALMHGPGIVVFQGAFTAENALGDATRHFADTIARQHDSGVQNGDHFAKPGANDRIWSALQKLALGDPEVYTKYYSNDILALVSEAWLGPMYQVTSSVNVVNPGGGAQNPHRDYHLGFMSTDTAAQFRAHVHRLSPALTLQGAVAHCDMPIESGPTMYLPFSQQYEAGYIAFNLPEFREYFADNYVQLPLAAGDAVFFNPALFHAAGHNTSSDIYRMANLLQVSSAFGRAMDSVNRETIVEAIYPSLVALAASGDERSVRNVVAASAEGYAFPTNLDLDQPVTGLAAETQAELVTRALATNMGAADLSDALREQTRRHQI
ncbi:phytanoyl-CoA dioxygenase [Rhodococcoides trifolii]|uniref:Phytanoyl-CoA dioxygenase n=1 Tax=Rhodococcoides trifolii TaxID=908250 RepID=A0A917D7Q7_9NOCA|nr:phytanoyl-CoA dioxygenase family protein [Rhodococcus trifolii]GGG13343.1 phytanoyl-CoA dioxygenase [Rhodococcus trifolii]